MSQKRQRVAALIGAIQSGDLDQCYVAYFDCFNRQLFFEAHEVLEHLWLARRGTANDLFYKGLIQLAGAFVHIQKHRNGPAAALFKLARTNLNRYPAVHQNLELAIVLELIDTWLARLASPAGPTPAFEAGWPKLALLPPRLESGLSHQSR